MSKVYLYTASGEYAGEADDYGTGILPNNSSRVAPPARPWGRYWPRWTGKTWELAEDHRERSAALYPPDLVQAATDYWLPEEGDDWQSQPRHAKAIGPLPDGATTTRPEKPAPTEEELFASLRAERDRRIAATDYLMTADYPLTDEQRVDVTAYRQALRDLPSQDGAPWDGGGEETPWPPRPTL